MLMEQQKEVYFNALSVNRAESARALEGFALRGVKNSVVEKYSDQAHFIYELLQSELMTRKQHQLALNCSKTNLYSPITGHVDLRSQTLPQKPKTLRTGCWAT